MILWLFFMLCTTIVATGGGNDHTVETEAGADARADASAAVDTDDDIKECIQCMTNFQKIREMF